MGALKGIQHTTVLHNVLPVMPIKKCTPLVSLIAKAMCILKKPGLGHSLTDHSNLHLCK